MRLSRRALPMLGALALPLRAQAQAFPNRPVRLITPFAAGVGAETTLRLFADGLARRWGQPVPVENRPGGDGVIAAMAFLGINDDHKIFFSFSGPLTVNPYTIPSLPYRPEQFAPISTVAIDHIAIAAAPEFGANDLSGAVALAQAQPGAFAWASSPGGITITFAAFAAQQRLELVRAQYRAVPEMLNDLATNRIQIAAMPLATALPQARAGRILLAAYSNQRQRCFQPTPDAQGCDTARKPRCVIGFNKQPADRGFGFSRCKPFRRHLAPEADGSAGLLHADHAIIISAHAGIGLKRRATGQDAMIGSWHMGMGADHQAHTAIETMAHGLFFR